MVRSLPVEFSCKDLYRDTWLGQSWVVRLGNSGLKVSKIILGCMSYGSPEWQDWVLAEEEGIKHIKYAYVKPFANSASSQAKLLLLDPNSYDNGIQTFDTANVCLASMYSLSDLTIMPISYRSTPPAPPKSSSEKPSNSTIFPAKKLSL